MKKRIIISVSIIIVVVLGSYVYEFYNLYETIKA